MGSRSKIVLRQAQYNPECRRRIDLAYIAGFLDGDGSLMLQIKKRKDGLVKHRFMCTICFYQDSRHEEPLKFIRKILGIGYFSRRNDGMSELRINGFAQIHRILQDLIPFIRFKKKQAVALMKTSQILSKERIRELSRSNLDKIVQGILEIQSENYSTKSKKTKEELNKILGLTP